MKDKTSENHTPASSSKRLSTVVSGWSIRTRLLAILTGLTVIALLATTFLSVNSLQSVGQSAQETSGAALRAQAEDYLLQLTEGAAERNDQLLEKIRQDANNVAQYAAEIYGHPEAFAREAYWRAEDYMLVGSEGQYINGEDDTSTAFVPNSTEIDDDLTKEVELSAYLDMLFASVYESDPNTVAIYIINPSDHVRYYPNIDLGSILDPDFRPTEGVFYTLGTPEENPDREVVWTPVYDDPAAQGLLVSAVAPIYTSQGGFVGTIGIDVSLDYLSADIEASKPMAGGYAFLVDDQGRAVALPEQGYQDILGRASEPGEFWADMSNPTAEFASTLAQMTTGETGFQSVTVAGDELFVAHAPLPGTGWSMASVVKAAEVLQAVGTLRSELEASTRSLMLVRILPVSLAVLAVIVVLGILMANRLTKPIQELAVAAEKIGAGQWDVALPQTGDDEIGVLNRTFAAMTTQLRQLVGGLEQRVAERTRALETSTEVSRRLSTILDPQKLAVEVVEQLQNAFGFYHAHIYFQDAASDDLVMAGGTGEAGRTMLARGHRIPHGKGLVGRAATTQEAVLIPDVSQETGWLPNPLLPDTKAEIAVPIRAGGQVLGVLDVQQNVTDGLTQEDVNLLESIANQVAVALQNARSFTEVQRRAEQETRANLISQHIQRATTFESLMQTAARELGQAMGAQRVNVQLAPHDAAEE